MKNILFMLLIAASTMNMRAQTQRVYCSEIDEMIKDKGVFPSALLPEILPKTALYFGPPLILTEHQVRFKSNVS